MARKILLADDSVTAQNMGRKILADAGYDVVTVNNGSAALKRITEIKPDLIVLDVYMPGYSGLEVCQRLKDSGETAHIPVLLTVGKLEPFKADEARRVRADAHIVKPFEASELLTAIMRLEDRIVPQQSEGARLAGEGGNWKTEGDTNPDTGWKSRLRFPSKKKKEEPESESDETAAGATFRDFRKGKGKNSASAAVAVKTPTPAPIPEPAVVPDIPRDITPEELDALSALAEKLDAPTAGPESVAAAAEAATTKAEAAPAEEAVPSAAADAKSEIETPAPIVESVAVAAAEVAAPAVETPAFEEKSEVKIPVELAASPFESVAAPGDLAAIEAQQRETDSQTQLAETAVVAAPVTVNAAALAQEAAPVDRNDEPIFASAAAPVEQAAEPTNEEIETKATEAVASTEKTETPAASSSGEIVADALESKPEESQAQQAGAEGSRPEKIEAVPVAVSMPEPQPEEAGPSDEELAEALRLLTPATGHTDVLTVPTRGTLVAAGQLLAEEAARNAASGPRWVAESMQLSPEEATASLEEEMFRTFAAVPAAISAAMSSRESESSGITGVSAIAATVEDRLAAVERAASANGSSERGAEVGSVAATTDTQEHGLSGSGVESTTLQTPAAEAAAEVAVVNLVNPAVDGSTSPEVAPETAPEPRGAEQHDLEQKDSAPVADEASAEEEEVAAATFADAVGQGEDEASTAAAEVATAASAEENQDSSPEIGGQEAMGKDGKPKSGKSNWHQIHTASASVAASSDVDTAKQAEPVSEQAPKAMAAAASAEAGTAAASVPDASTIASIVDSVMADLRPRIVEEIARKLAGK